MRNLVLKIAPLEESLSLKARIHADLKAAISAMNIYDDNAELRLDERALSAQFGISRTPLREALAQLESEGLVRVLPRRGVFIVRKTKAEILDMITVWAALEGMAARLVCKVAADAEIAQLRRQHETFHADPAIRAHIGEYSDANIRFHQTIVRLSRSRLIEQITDGLFLSRARHSPAHDFRGRSRRAFIGRPYEDHRSAGGAPKRDRRSPCRRPYLAAARAMSKSMCELP